MFFSVEKKRYFRLWIASKLFHKMRIDLWATDRLAWPPRKRLAGMHFLAVCSALIIWNYGLASRAPAKLSIEKSSLKRIARDSRPSDGQRLRTDRGKVPNWDSCQWLSDNRSTFFKDSGLPLRFWPKIYRRHFFGPPAVMRNITWIEVCCIK